MTISDNDDSWLIYGLDAVEALQQIEASLLHLEERGEDSEQINLLYRALHTLKGNSALLGLSALEQVAHAAEDLVGLVRDGHTAFDRIVADLLLSVVDALAAMVEQAARERADVEDPAVPALIARVRAETARRGAGVEVVAAGASRGEILIWSDPPPAVGERTKLDIFAGEAQSAEDADASSSTPVVEVHVRKPTMWGAASDGSTPGADFLRVDARKLGQVMDLASEVVLACGAVTHHPNLEPRKLEGFASSAYKLETLIRELQSEIASMRLVPIDSVFQRLKRVVRDTAQRTGKHVQLCIVGADTEIDKFVVDSLHDPLVHIVRNAIDHGIELPAERLVAGKTEVGTITLEAAHHGGEVRVRVRDDGRGLHRERILARAIERGLVDHAQVLSDEQVNELVFAPGFSTKEAVDELSGRGVGMDVVKTAIEALRGRVRICSETGKGSTIDMVLPLTMAFVDAMVLRDKGKLFAVPLAQVSEVFSLDLSRVSHNAADSESSILVRDRMVPMMCLSQVFRDRSAGEERVGKVVVVVRNSRGDLAIPVDEIVGNQPVMLKPIRGVVAGVRAAAGYGMLRTGDVALTLDCERLHA
jgi:two-component system, chemotaxis family, sensor kinase CheA